MDQHRGGLRLDPFAVTGAKEKDLYPHVERREAAASKRRRNDAGLERDLVDREAGAYGVSHEENKGKSQAGRGKPRLARKSQKPKRLAYG